MDLRQINYFMRVFEEKSFTRAAERIHVVQPALSRQIALLEEELNAKLFVRGPQGVEPTLAATRLYDGVMPVIDMLANIRKEIRSLAGSKMTGKFSCGFPPHFSGAFVGKVVGEYIQEFPDVQIQIVEDFSASLTELVSKGVLDFALGTIPEERSGLAVEFVYTDEVALISGDAICGPSFRPCSLDQIPGLKIIVPSKRNALAQQLAAVIAKGEVSPAQILHIDSASAIRDLIHSNGWAALAPLCAVKSNLEARRQLYIYPIERPEITYKLGLVRRQNQPLADAAEVFLTRIRDLVSRSTPTWASLAAKYDRTA